MIKLLIIQLCKHRGYSFQRAKELYTHLQYLNHVEKILRECSFGILTKTVFGCCTS